MNSQMIEAKETTVFKKMVNCTPETHLEYSLYFKGSDKRTRLLSGSINWQPFESAEEARDYILRYQTEHVKNVWCHLEISIPNRNNFGDLVSGFIKDTVFCAITRTVH